MNAKSLVFQTWNSGQGSVHALPFEGDSVDATTCFFMLHHLEDIKFALFEIKRVLKKGGLLTAVEPMEHQHHHGPQLSEAAWRELFEDVGFYVETENLEGAVVLRATKRE